MKKEKFNKLLKGLLSTKPISKINSMGKIKVFELDFGDTNLLSTNPKEILSWVESDLTGMIEGDELNYRVTIKTMSQKEIDALPEWT